MMPFEPSELRSIRDSVSLVGRLSDSLVRLGPFSLGIDGVLSWIPAVGEIYSLGAGAFILGQGVRAGVPASVLARAAVILGLRTFGDAVPIRRPLVRRPVHRPQVGRADGRGGDRPQARVAGHRDRRVLVGPLAGSRLTTFANWSPGARLSAVRGAAGERG